MPQVCAEEGERERDPVSFSTTSMTDMKVLTEKEYRAGDMAHLVECLPSIPKAVGSSPSTIYTRSSGASLQS